MKKLSILIILLASACVSFAEDHTIQQYLSIRSARSPSLSPEGGQFAYLTNVSGTWQVWATPLEASKARQLTNFDDNVSFVRWLGDDSGIIFGKAKGGNENTQFFWMKTDGSGVRALTEEPNVRHNFGLVSDDGKFIAYASNKRDRNFFDIYRMEVATGKEELLWQQNGNNSVQAMDISGKLIVSRDGTELSLDNNLYLVDPVKKTEVLLTPHKGAAQFDDARFTADGIVFTHNNGREFIGLAQLRQKNAAGDDWSPANLEMSMIDDAAWDIGGVEMPAYGNKMAYTVNREGFSELYLRKYETGGKPLITTIEKTAEMVKLPDKGIVNGISFDHDQDKLAFAFSSPSRNTEILVYDLKKEKLTQYTWSDLAGLSRQDFVEPTLIKYKTFDGRELSAWFYQPSRTRSFSIAMGAGTPKAPSVSMPAVPVIVSVHGGPEGQERPGFSPLYQYFVSRGYAILAPNVRGSTGYGKTFTHLDDVKKREDSVKDLVYSVKWLTGPGGGRS